MNQKFMVFLSILLIVIAIIGLSITIKTNKEMVSRYDSNLTVKHNKKRDVELLVLNKDIKIGQNIDLTYFDKKIIQVEDDDFEKNNNIILYDSDDLIGLKGAIALENLSANSRLKYSMFAKKGSIEYSKFRLKPKNGMFNLKFSLDERQYMLLSDLHPNELVDIYFKYEIKLGSGSKVSAPKKKDKDGYIEEKIPADVKFIPMFKSKRILYFEPKTKESEELNENGRVVKKMVEVENEGNVYIELDRAEIKKVYALENIGNFIILPADDKDDLNQVFSTNTILPKEFIKEIRGSDNDNTN